MNIEDPIGIDSPVTVQSAAKAPEKGRGSPWEVLAVAARLGLTSFGGPIAHLGYFHQEYVVRRAWLDEGKYADLIALCQMIPGPSSSQLGIAIGIERAGLLGGIAAWLGFTLPSAIAMTGFALLAHGADIGGAGWLHGLLVVAVAVVAQALWSMARALTPDSPRRLIAIAVAIASLLIPTSLTQILLIAAAALAGLAFLKEPEGDEPDQSGGAGKGGKLQAVCALSLFAALLVALPILRAASRSHWIDIIDSFYRSGSLVFGGGHVVLPLLQREVVPPGWISNQAFLTGYGAAQALPGPLFAFSAYLGAAMGPSPNGPLGAALALLAIYAPAFLLVLGLLPFWRFLRRQRRVRSALAGANAAVVGILLATWYSPVWTSAVSNTADFAFCLAAFFSLAILKARPWIIVLAGAFLGEVFGIVSKMHF